MTNKAKRGKGEGDSRAINNGTCAATLFIGYIESKSQKRSN